MSDAAIVPLMSQNFPEYASSRVRGVGGYPTAIWRPNIGEADITDPSGWRAPDRGSVVARC